MTIRRNRHTKIVSTLGPSSDTYDQIKTLSLAGADVFRLNFSHGNHDEHQRRYDHIRRLEEKIGSPIAVIADLQGPKLRIGQFEQDQIELTEGQSLTLDLSDTPGDQTRVPFPHPEAMEVMEEGQRILLDDGRVVLMVEKAGSKQVVTRVMSGQKLSSRKGVNLPEANLRISPITEKDRVDMEAALDMGVDFIALSFVQSADDLVEAKKLIDGRAKLISKIERPQAVTNIEAIIDLSDAVMLARGDLGVEIPPERVPSVQKHVVGLCRQAGKPLIIATQMLESMVDVSAPTRAEVSDVATAIYDGADAVMLSAETAAGNYPNKSVNIMDRIACQVENDPHYRRFIRAEQPDPNPSIAGAITAACHQVADTIAAAAIVNFTTSGSTVLRTARHRPNVPILSLCADRRTARQLVLSYGVHAVHTDDVGDFFGVEEKAVAIARSEEIATPGDKLVITAGVPFGTPGSTNILRVCEV